MTAGDIKGEVEVITVTLGATTTVGQLVHFESDGKWDPTADGDLGTFGVAIDAGDDTETARVVIRGRVEVTNGSTTAIKKGSGVIAYDTGTIIPSDHGATGEGVGIAVEEIAISGTGTILLGAGES
jgi:hypothetical protein